MADLQAEVERFRARLPALMDEVAAVDVPAVDLSAGAPWPWTVEAIVLHVVEELYQHLGHVDVTVDLLGATRPTAR
ncbi:MAG: DUF664 domain-containing protein [Actinomycetota bacterium]|nr:DUF664 domain-containing protein [Actinomycetota bacterium]